jgi:hypothetical protein
MSNHFSHKIQTANLSVPNDRAPYQRYGAVRYSIVIGFFTALKEHCSNRFNPVSAKRDALYLSPTPDVNYFLGFY